MIVDTAVLHAAGPRKVGSEMFDPKRTTHGSVDGPFKVVQTRSTAVQPSRVPQRQEKEQGQLRRFCEAPSQRDARGYSRSLRDHKERLTLRTRE